MQIIKIFLFGIAGLVVLLLIVALFVQKEYAIEREITISKQKGAIFSYLKFIKNQDNYSKWVMTDPAMKKDFRGTDGTVGFVYAWDSHNKNAGKGEQEITGITEGQNIKMEVRFERPMEGNAKTYMITEDAPGNQTKVKWGMKGKNKYPLNLMNLFIPNMLGKDIDTSLNTLKRILEKS